MGRALRMTIGGIAAACALTACGSPNERRLDAADADTTGADKANAGLRYGATERPAFARIAQRVFADTSAVRPGDVVAISGGAFTVPFMEALAVEVYKAGATPIMLVNTDRAARAGVLEVPEQHLGQIPPFWSAALPRIDLWVTLPDVQDQKAVYDGIPEARFAKAARGSEEFLGILNRSGLRLLTIDYPTKADAAQFGVDSADYARMRWAALDADQLQIAASGAALKAALAGAKEVRVTSPNGTDFWFAVGARRVVVDDGSLPKRGDSDSPFGARRGALPTGAVNVAPLEWSANGRLSRASRSSSATAK
jgi:leucyl aminopeptidase (aminopeptidase T)